MIDPDADPRRPETRQMIVIHKALRREFDLAPDAVRAVADGDTHRAGAVAEHLELILQFLHHHHRGEDDLLWPALSLSDAAEPGLIASMSSQHADVDRHIAQATIVLRRWRVTAAASDRNVLATSLEGLGVDLGSHLDLEEDRVLPLVHQHVTVDTWEELARDGQDNLPSDTRLALLQLGMILEDADPAERRWFLSEVPLPARVAWRLAGARRYLRHVELVRA